MYHRKLYIESDWVSLDRQYNISQGSGCHSVESGQDSPRVFEACEIVPHVANNQCLHKIGRAARVNQDVSYVEVSYFQGHDEGVVVRLQYPGGIYWWGNDCPIYGAGAPSSYPRQDGVDTLAYRCDPQQLLSLSFGVILLVTWASVNIVYNGFGGGWDPRAPVLWF